jgi:phage terminase large subunit-like protein
MSAEERLRCLSELSAAERAEMAHDWPLWARDGQLAPDGDWRLWLVMAGRGFGKTRMGAEWVRSVAQSDPSARIALVAASLGEARSVMVEGESGLLRCCPSRRRPRFEPSLRRVVWPNGAVATLYSAAEPDSLRGPQHSHAWCDEIAKWDNSGARAELAWDNMLMGLRLGDGPQAMATTTPRAVPLLTRLLGDGDVVVTRGRTDDNRANLPQRYIRDIRRSLGSALLARQELDGEMLLDHAGALWTRALIEQCREPSASAAPVRTVVASIRPLRRGRRLRHRGGGAGRGWRRAGSGDATVRAPGPNAGRAPWPKRRSTGTPTAWWPRPIRAAPWWKASCARPASPCPCGWSMPRAARARGPSRSPPSMNQAGCAIAANLPHWRTSCAA